MVTSVRFGRRDWLLVLGFVLSVAVAGVFAVRSFHAASGMRRDQPIQPWMSVPYVAHSYHVPSSALYQALGLSATRPRDRRTLEEIARSQDRPVRQVISDLQAAIVAYRAASPPTPPLPRSTP